MEVEKLEQSKVELATARRNRKQRERRQIRRRAEPGFAIRESAYFKTRYRTNPAYRAKCIERAKRNQKTRAKELQVYRRMRRYGLTKAAFDELLTAQESKCKICLDPLPTGKGLAVDHDHKTGRVRGLLCHRCNAAIGLLRENSAIIMRAAHYVENSSRQAHE